MCKSIESIWVGTDLPLKHLGLKGGLKKKHNWLFDTSPFTHSFPNLQDLCDVIRLIPEAYGIQFNVPFAENNLTTTGHAQYDKYFVIHIGLLKRRFFLCS